MTRYALRFTRDNELPSEPPSWPLRAVPREEVTRSEGRSAARGSARASSPALLSESGVFPRVGAQPDVFRSFTSSGSFESFESFEPTLVDARLSLDLEAVDAALASAYDPSMAAPTMRERLQEMREIAEALGRIHTLSMRDGLASLFGPDTALSRYMRQVQCGCASFARVCDELSTDLGVGHPVDWLALRRQVAAAARGYDPGLREDIGAEVALLAETHRHLRGVVAGLGAQLEQLFAAVAWFEESTRRYIGLPGGA